MPEFVKLRREGALRGKVEVSTLLWILWKKDWVGLAIEDPSLAIPSRALSARRS
jgi:hypothetical protein